MIHWLPAGPEKVLGRFADDPAQPDPALAKVLTPAETADWRNKRATPAGRSWLLGRLAAKNAAGRLWGLPPEAVEVRTGPEGRPDVRPLRPPLAGAGLHVSISHTPGAAAGAAGPAPVGVDIERRERPLSERVRAWAFDGAERALIDAADPGLPWPPALALWCAKEAAAKSWGRGLLNHLSRVRATGADWAAGRLTVAWLDAEAPATAEARLLISGDYLLALAERGEF